MNRLSAACAVAVSVTLLASGLSAQPHPTADLLSELIRINTSNPPGHEQAMAEFLAAKLKPLGFEVDIIPTPEAGKAHFIARSVRPARELPVPHWRKTWLPPDAVAAPS